MWIMYVWIYILCAWATVSAAMARSELRCEHPRCKSAGGTATSGHLFFVEGKRIFIVSDLKSKLMINCQNWTALDSPAMPSFTNAVEVSSVTLYKCPPPGNASFAEALAALNVKLLQTETKGTLKLWDLPPQPQLTARHFVGFESLVSLELHAYWDEMTRPAPGFLAPLHNLHYLNVRDLQLPTGELDHPPASLQSINLVNSGVRYLPEAVRALSNLKDLDLDENVLWTDEVVNLAPTIDTAWVNITVDPRPTRLVRCDALRGFHATLSVVEALPERWVTACLRLQVVALFDAPKLTSLPTKLLEGANALSHFELVYSVIETLPKGLFAHVPNLRSINLSHNRLRLIPSELFTGPRTLQTLDLSHNKLGADVQDALAQLSNLTELSLANNPIGNLCEPFGHSRLINLKKLTSLTLSDTSLTSICSDWRLNMTKLTNLFLIRTNISKLTFADLQYTRNEIHGLVYMWGTPITSVQLSEEDYRAALKAPETQATVVLDQSTGLNCDCNMYWTRLALERARHTIRLENLNCNGQYGHRPLSSLFSDELCHV